MNYHAVLFSEDGIIFGFQMEWETQAQQRLHQSYIFFSSPPVLDMFDWGKYSFLVLAGG